MTLTQLELHHFRNISASKLTFSPGLNLIIGPNASGKTSLLESIHALGTGRSFRTSRIDRLIQHGHTQLQLLAHIQDDSDRVHIVGLQRQTKKTQAKINGEFVTKLTALIKLLPIHLLQPETHYLLEQGPRLRRQFLDWGVFHVEHSYLDVWQDYHRTLRQRNALIRRRAASRQIRAWNKPLADFALTLHHMRTRYIDSMGPHIEFIATELLDEAPHVAYSSGWPQDMDLLHLLESSVLADLERGYTQHGAHRADLVITAHAMPAQLHYSRGQQKLLVATLRLAHLLVLRDLGRNSGILLVDDLPSELDRQHRSKLLKLLAGMGNQTFITATEADLLDRDLWPENKMFHVERGSINEML
jgi:DNA replication and repair protein RecF